MNAEPRRILIVDDDEAVNEFLVWALLERGHEVASAHNGAQAVDLISRDRFDVVLLDIVMPVMGGFTVIQEIRKAGLSLPIIVLSAHVGCLDAGRILSLGANLVLSKPVDLSEILDAVRQVTGVAVGSDRNWGKVNSALSAAGGRPWLDS
jgi:CheY-like chemotaxis protein